MGVPQPRKNKPIFLIISVLKAPSSQSVLSSPHVSYPLDYRTQLVHSAVESPFLQCIGTSLNGPSQCVQVPCVSFALPARPTSRIPGLKEKGAW
ncbi:hypothetical protein LZ32DRAFT_145546 [Colletotrichum eremochloae]|nr:hypothetical protein LZ32DRAFT_145546 [Colletotrichum eremochloae]